jgi:hypothetical protein
MLTVVGRETEAVVNVKLAVVAPAGTWTDSGTTTTVLLLESATTRPPAGAGAMRPTAPVRTWPPTKLLPWKVREDG